MAEPAAVVARVRRWLRTWVVGLDLCPFAAGPLRAGRVRIAISPATDLQGALQDLFREAEYLLDSSADTVETTLVVYPDALSDWDAFLDVLALAEDLLADHGLDADLQIVGFHPKFTFADSEPGDPADRVNRSPVPLLHLLRTAAVAVAVDAHPDSIGIATRNADLLRSADPAVEAAWEAL